LNNNIYWFANFCFSFFSTSFKDIDRKNAEILESYLMIFSGFFIAYVVFFLHNFFVLNRSRAIIKGHQKLQQNIFDLSFF